MNTLVSSANNIRFDRLEALLISLMYSKKNRSRGPMIEPWGTQTGISFLNDSGHYIQPVAFCLKRNFLSSPALSHEYRNVRFIKKDDMIYSVKGFWEVMKYHREQYHLRLVSLWYGCVVQKQVEWTPQWLSLESGRSQLLCLEETFSQFQRSHLGLLGWRILTV